MLTSKMEIKMAILNGQEELMRKQLIIQEIRKKYDQNDELALLRQFDTKHEEYEEYNTYVEECKKEASRRINEAKSEL